MIDTIVSGLVHGNVYVLAAAGISLIFGVTGVVSFVQGLVVGFGVILGWWFIDVCGWPWWLALLAMAVSSALIGWVINPMTMHPLIRAFLIAALLATFAASMVLDNLSQILFKADTREYPAPLPTDDLPVGGVRPGTSNAVTLGSTVAVMLALRAWLRFGREGTVV